MSAPAERSDGLPVGSPRHLGGDGTVPVLRLAASSGRPDPACIRELPDGARIVAGSTGDHALVLQLLIETQQAQLGDDFQSRLDEPSYRPGDRLLVRRRRELLAHVHVTNHLGWFEGQRVPLMKLEDFTGLPEFSSAGYAEELLASAEALAAGEGAVLGVAQADELELLLHHGWSLVRGQGHTRASARAVLAYLDAQDAARRRRRKPALQVRTWRHFELDAIRTVYEQTARGLWGPLLRSEEAWQWAIGRKAHDQIMLAVDAEGASPEDSARDLINAGARVAAYAIVRGSAIVEMMSLAEYPEARSQLLARACQDAIDRDLHSISLYTPATDALHELLVTAGGAWNSDASAGKPRRLLKLLAPEKWVERMFPVWHEHARAAGVARPQEIGFALEDGDRYRFWLTRRSARLDRTAKLPDLRVACSRATFESLLTGNLSAPKAIAAGQLQLSPSELAETLTGLFPARFLWQSQLETMRL